MSAPHVSSRDAAGEEDRSGEALAEAEASRLRRDPPRRFATRRNKKIVTAICQRLSIRNGV